MELLTTLLVSYNSLLITLFSILLIIFIVPSLLVGWLVSNKKIIDNEEAPEDETMVYCTHKYPMYFFIDDSGCCKNTGVEKVLSELQEKGIRYIYISINDHFNEFVANLDKKKYFTQHIEYLDDQEDLQSTPILLHFFLSKLIPKYTGDEVIIIGDSLYDYRELEMWASLIQTGYLPNAKIIYTTDVIDENTHLQSMENITARNKKTIGYKIAREWLSRKLPTGIEFMAIDKTTSINERDQYIKEIFVKDGLLTE